MCGFAGFLTTSGLSQQALTQHVSAMVAPLVHRGPDGSGSWVDEEAGVALGFRRLAILDLSPAGDQPMRSASGRFVLAFNGEVYNFLELREELGGSGQMFRGGSDTEVVLQAFEHWGIQGALSRFVGMFAMAVWDRSRRELTLVRDRLGKKPLYVYSGPGLVSFGSELKALAAGPSFDREVDRSALASYLRYLYVAAPRTIFKRATKIPAGHLLTICGADRSLPDTRCYWSIGDAAARGLARPLSGDAGEAIAALESTLREAVRCRLRSDVPLGALLSGGVDSSTVVALMQESCARPAKTYTIGFDDEDFDEARHASRVAHHLGTEHTELRITGEDACALVPGMADIFDEPLADPSQIPTYLVSRLARQEVTVALCGDGGDELFGGYNRYVYGARMLPRLDRLPRRVRASLASSLAVVPAVTWTAAQRITSSLLPSLPAQRVGERVEKLRRVMAAATTGAMYRSLLSAWHQPELLVGGSEPDDDANAQILNRTVPASLVDRMMLADQTTYLPDDLLAKVDRASMAVSLEVRAPLLDHRVVELSWRIPHGLKLRGPVGKWVLRQVLYRRLPRELVDRPKMGFSVPIDRWLRGPLREWAGDLLASGRRGWLNEQAVARAWTDLQEGRRHAGAAIWAVVMLQAWRQRWLA